ncbi:MAG: hypothetical protein JNK63_03205 [Chthonomonas sp.]|nr:hypothetical protein [Chthonomonas sp.]
MLLDGTICHARPAGTSLEHFSDKPRLVLLAYHDDVHAFVYPLTSAKTKDAIRVSDGPATAWLVIKKGLFRIPITAVTPAERHFPQFGRLRERIQRDLVVLEESHNQEQGPLTQRGLESLDSLRHELPSPEPKPKPVSQERPMTDDELFQHYLEKFDKEH